MSRIKGVFEALQARGEKALIPFVMAGDPNLDVTRELVLSMAKSGGDIIELGIPYSDPLADGTVNQRAAARALRNGTRIGHCMALASSIRRETQIPLLFLVYFNSVLQYGVERFLSDCVRNGVDGLVIPDLPFEERQQYREIFRKIPIDIIPMAAPTSGPRLPKILEHAAGFVYCVTSLGVTGTRQRFDAHLGPFMEQVASVSRVPRVMGFGISTAEQAAALKAHAEGMIVGSALVRRLEEASTPQEGIRSICGLLTEIKTVLR